MTLFFFTLLHFKVRFCTFYSHSTSLVASCVTHGKSDDFETSELKRLFMIKTKNNFSEIMAPAFQMVLHYFRLFILINSIYIYLKSFWGLDYCNRLIEKIVSTWIYIENNHYWNLKYLKWSKLIYIWYIKCIFLIISPPHTQFLRLAETAPPLDGGGRAKKRTGDVHVPWMASTKQITESELCFSNKQSTDRDLAS